LPQEPQLLVLVKRLASQPLAPLPSQLAHPGLHVGEQPYDEHLVVPLAFVHVVPQPPQLEVVESEVSQPLLVLPSQSPQPEVQVEHAQLPELHLG